MFRLKSVDFEGRYTFIHMERKSTLNLKDKDDILSQITNTRDAFLRQMQENDLFRENILRSEKSSSIVVYSMVFCESGDEEMINILLEQGYFVITEALKLYTPKGMIGPALLRD